MSSSFSFVPSCSLTKTTHMVVKSNKDKSCTTAFYNKDNFFGLGFVYSCLTCRVPVILLLLLLFFLTKCSCVCNNDDRDSLLIFASNISSPSLNWSASDCCVWEGIGCDVTNGGSASGDRVTRFSLPFRGLNGGISPSLANLTRLSYLNLSHNQLSGTLPVEIFSSLVTLQVLDVSNNRLEGQLPSFGRNGMDGFSSVRVLDLSSNHFRGEIVLSDSLLQSSWNLTSFNVSNNSFIGQIPASNICTVASRSVSVLDFSINNFRGEIASGIGQCSLLKIFRAGFNFLSGNIPDDIYQVTSLEQLSLPFNGLSGSISDSVVNLSKLKVLELYSNQLTGILPRNIGLLTNLLELVLYQNNLTGTLPPSLTNCTNLVMLNLRANFLKGKLSEFNFSSLAQLSTLDLSSNNFTGDLPVSLFSCTSLTAVRLASNQLGGEISPDIQKLKSLSFISISNNNLTNFASAIRILMGCNNLTTLILSLNFWNEPLPDDDGTIPANGFQNLQALALGGCLFTGQIPTWLSRFRNLQVLDLSVNQITGSIPGWLGSLPQLFYIDLSSNLLTGEFPVELTGLQALTSGTDEQLNQTSLELPVFVTPYNATNQQYNQLASLPPAIYLGNNSLSGPIPEQIGRLKSLHVLDLSHNDFSGIIPDQISNLTNLERLDLSENHFSGEIPASLKGLHFLSWFSVAYNNLQGPIPFGGQFDTFPSSSFVGNPGLCGTALQRSCSSTPQVDRTAANHKRTNTQLIIGLVLGICFGTGLFVTLVALWILSKRRIIPGGDTDKIEMGTLSSNSFSGFPPEFDKDASMVVIFPSNTEEIKDLTIAELLKASDYFNQSNIVGCGGFGLVYKATLGNGTKLAVKKLSGDFGLMEREFKAEVEALSTAQHQNLVSLQGYCIHEGFRLLIYSYMENGSLDSWLHENSDGPSQLDWPKRLNIARGASCGLAYMHQICEPHIVHRDIKSSNILLDEKFEAHVADFGLSRLILPYHTHVTTEVVGTLGYIPPEYGQAWVATLRGDMYSFGVVILELLTGKRPMEVFKPKMSRELVSWVQQMRSEGKQDQVFDPLLRGKGYDDEMLQVLDVACMCVNQNPFKRPTINEVVDWLKNVGSDKNQYTV